MSINFTGNPSKIVQAATGVVGALVGGGTTTAGAGSVVATVTAAATAAAPVVIGAAAGVAISYGVIKAIKWFKK